MVISQVSSYMWFNVLFPEHSSSAYLPAHQLFFFFIVEKKGFIRKESTSCFSRPRLAAFVLFFQIFHLHLLLVLSSLHVFLPPSLFPFFLCSFCCTKKMWKCSIRFHFKCNRAHKPLHGWSLVTFFFLPHQSLSFSQLRWVVTGSCRRHIQTFLLLLVDCIVGDQMPVFLHFELFSTLNHNLKSLRSL